MDARQAFRLGFAMKLAEHGIAPSDLFCKEAILPTVALLGTALPALATAGATLAGAGSVLLPTAAGTAAGTAASGMTDDEITDTDEAKKILLIRRYRKMIDDHKVSQKNKALSEAARV